MLITDITHKTTLKGLIKHNITEDDLLQITSLHDLHIQKTMG